MVELGLVDTFKALYRSPHTRRTTERLLALTRELSTDQGQILAAWAIELLDAEGENERDSVIDAVILPLACAVPNSLTHVYIDLIERRVLYPSVLFHNATIDSRKLLARRLREGIDDEYELRDTVQAFAWVDDSVVHSAFSHWQQTPPSWATRLWLPLQSYPVAAGWYVTGDGMRHPLYHQTCYHLAPTASVEGVPSTSVSEPVGVITLHEGHCPWCDLRLVTLFDLHGDTPKLAFLDLGIDRLCIAMCVRCTGYTTIYMDIDTQGDSRWSRYNVRPDYLGPTGEYRLPTEQKLMLGPPRRTPFEAHRYITDRGISQIGGYPTWEQDARFPTCPICRRLMPFIGQLHWTDIEEFGAGTTYAYYCRDCRIAATNYESS